MIWRSNSCFIKRVTGRNGSPAACSTASANFSNVITPGAKQPAKVPSNSRSRTSAAARHVGANQSTRKKGTGPIGARHRRRLKVGRAAAANWTCPLFRCVRCERGAIAGQQALGLAAPGRATQDDNASGHLRNLCYWRQLRALEHFLCQLRR